MANRLCGKYFIHQKCGTLHHPAGTAAGAETTPFAAESDQTLVMTVFTAHTQKAIFQPTTLEKIFELSLNVTRQALSLTLQRGLI
ncbi:hypothetical protein A3749_21910 [Oleiphilus sp. HI0078]|nr:hypothetical protein A3749_21910 [Oleiphilus sp. HI0078]